ncbi:uncharacterized protein MYCFIDRAFT_135244 [Pseudocercospora fijiensis CIRAD86]|uniref:HECT-type E3 ubiquitin transferase n=1 Tax=Pseudocercospora fijiensis (strain CIRAD86) TaxID=383855 RepID=M3B3H2_PSEFD|nr:uncharacterized protein MYCFIDRAFT_135244 [Pseudocercospora fijiensis CIRAD86]EME83938.1 hypothetical protein MYCFIDRAFT_135244 [Pseudocercospora fijiensis CIRAD86]
MYQTFSGNSRRPRQVNLSGRPGNPFAKSNGTAAAGGSGAQQAVASAQQDRINRQIQRERARAASKVQKTFRGHSSRRRTFKIWRQIWDEQEERANGAYSTADESLGQLRRLLLFFSPRRDPSDVKRLAWYGTRQVTTSDTVQCKGDEWSRAYSKLQRACIAALRARVLPDRDNDRTVLGILTFAARQTKFTSDDAVNYYDALTSSGADLPQDSLQGALLAPLQSRAAYEGLAVLLARPLDQETTSLLRTAIDAEALSEAVASRLAPPSLPRSEANDSQRGLSTRSRVWLLGNLIALVEVRSSMAFMSAISQLLGSLADSIDFESTPLDLENTAYDNEILASVQSGLPLNTFMQKQVNSLLHQHSIRNLLVGKQNLSGNRDAQALAGYALTLLRCFPRRSDEIRMWLHLGPTRVDSPSPTTYLWNATKQTQVFSEIWSSSRGVVQLLKNRIPSPRERDDWTIILVFLEMFSFDLKIMDDEEFMGKSPVSKRNSAVPVPDVANLVTFLKNLGFTLVYDAGSLNNSDALPARDQGSLFTTKSRFGNASQSNDSSANDSPLLVAQLPGLTSDYLKGVVTSLLRAIYERDSRRNFLPKGHWLMTERFNMDAFTQDVVIEEESRHVIQQQEDEDKDDDSDSDFNDRFDTPRTGASSYARVLRSQEARARAQRKASRRRYLESMAPKLEILQNMPFFIPFRTRVEIFRQFVRLDQEKRRFGTTDPDLWRQQMMFQPQQGPPRDLLARHHAKVKRTQEFQDAYEQFYELGADLKEPIQITFLDQWDMPEAGIDGGGVTKEFLTSVISQAFDQDPKASGHRFFVENDQHLLYPNPTIFEDLKLQHQLYGFSERSPEVAEACRDLGRQYEFLGRIIGKCLYEGILVDVSFAGFFLKKWALTGGTGSARSESHYRPNINDLRELDEGLYRGLLQVKNADNAEELGMTFSVTDEVGPPDGKRVVEVDLVPHGGNIAVTNENRLQYINLIAAYRLARQASQQTRTFLRGLSDIIQPSWLSMFNQSELQILIGGAAAGIDVNDLRRNTQYGGTYVIGNDGMEHPSVQMFWNVMQKMEDQDRRKVLKFVTSTPRGPLLGFGHLNPRFSIRDSGSDENRYPTTSTCVNLLKLPMYKSEAVLREKLLAAVNSGAGFDLS